jgi:hypothetical protein
MLGRAFADKTSTGQLAYNFTMDNLEVFVPVATARVDERPLAPRLNQLPGARIAWLDNMKANAKSLLDYARQTLQERDASFETIVLSKNATTAAPDSIMEKLRTCDAVVLAIAD